MSNEALIPHVNKNINKHDIETYNNVHIQILSYHDSHTIIHTIKKEYTLTLIYE